MTLCRLFVSEHGIRVNEEQIEAAIHASLESFLDLISEEKWLTACDTHYFVAVELTTKPPKLLTLHAHRDEANVWTIATPDEYPVGEEYMKRRIESEAAIIRKLNE